MKDNTKNDNDSTFMIVNTMIKDYTVNTLISQDDNEIVFNGVNNVTGVDVEICVVDKDTMRFISNDVFMMKMLFHKGVVQLYEVVECKGKVIVVKERRPQWTLRDVSVVNEMEVFNIFAQIISVVRYMHLMGVYHLNINVDNVRVDVNKGNLIKLTKFYYSKYINKDSNNSSNSNVCVNEEYDVLNCASPEIHSHLPFISSAVDVWSCGVILYYLITNTFPFGDNDSIDKDALLNGNINYNNHTNTISPELKDLISKMLHYDQHKRISINDIINHKWFINHNVNNNAIIEGINWYKMKYPIDDNILQLTLQYNSDINLIRNDLLNIKHNANTALYKLCVIKYNTTESISDLYSKAFINYITQEHNEEQISKQQINDIISSFKYQQELTNMNDNLMRLSTAVSINVINTDNNNSSYRKANTVNNSHNSELLLLENNNNNKIEHVIFNYKKQISEQIKESKLMKRQLSLFDNYKCQYNDILKKNRNHSVTSLSTKEQFRNKIFQKIQCNTMSNSNSFNHSKKRCNDIDIYDSIKQSPIYKQNEKHKEQIQDEELTDDMFNAIINNEVELAFKVAIESLNNNVYINNDDDDDNEDEHVKHKGISLLSHNESIDVDNNHSSNNSDYEETQSPVHLPSICDLSQSIAHDDDIDLNKYITNNNNKKHNNKSNNNISYHYKNKKATHCTKAPSKTTKQTINQKPKIVTLNNIKQKLPVLKSKQHKHYPYKNNPLQTSKHNVSKNISKQNQTSTNTTINSITPTKYKPKPKVVTRLQKHKNISLTHSPNISLIYKDNSSSLITHTERIKNSTKDESNIHKNSITMYSKHINMHIPDLDISTENEIFIQDNNSIITKDNHVINNNTLRTQTKEEDIKCKHMSLLHSKKTTACGSRTTSTSRANYMKGIHPIKEYFHNNNKHNKASYINKSIDNSKYNQVKQLKHKDNHNNNKHKYPYIPQQTKHHNKQSSLLTNYQGRNNTFLYNHNNNNTSYTKTNRSLNNSIQTINNSKNKIKNILSHSPYSNRNSYQTPPQINRNRNKQFIPSFRCSSPFKTTIKPMQLYYEINLGLFKGLIDINCISHLNLQDTVNHIRNKLKEHNIFYIQSNNYLFKCNSKTQRFDIEIKEIYENIYYYYIKYKKTNGNNTNEDNNNNNNIIPLLFN